MREMLKGEYDDFERAMNTSPLFSGIRINTLKNGAREAVLNEFGEMKGIPWCADGYYADKAVISGNHPYHIAGLFYFQEPSAMSTVSALPIENGDYVLDLCAAPGGKATQAAAKMCGEGLLVANEINKSRARILSDNIERLGIKNAVVTNETPQRLAEKYPRFFDKIIVDAPCSGEGMFRKEPQAVTEWSAEHVSSCAERQKNILSSSVQMLRGGGMLVYSTCTFAPEENERVCAYLLDNFKVELVTPKNLGALSEGVTEWSSSNYDMTKTRRIFPHKQNGEGHFVALFRNKDAPNDRAEVKQTKPVAEENLYREFEEKFLNTRLTGNFSLFGENLYLLPDGADIDKIKVVRAGLLLGTCRKNRFEPSHALCLALNARDIKNTVDFDLPDVELKKYLSGETIEYKENGWCAVTVNGFPIGWGKASGGVLKNRFPKYMRLRG